MVTLTKILFPTDFSSFADHALSYAVAMAQEFDATLYMLYVEELLPYVPHDPDRKFPDADAVAQQADKAMKAAVGGDAVVTVKRFIARGFPADEIVSFARNNGIDLIVMSTHGRTGLKHVLLGSTTEKIVRMAPCPVLSIRHPEHEFVMP